jgi:hypothetical protein
LHLHFNRTSASKAMDGINKSHFCTSEPLFLLLRCACLPV